MLIFTLFFVNAFSDIANGATINANAIMTALHARTVFVLMCILFRIRHKNRIYYIGNQTQVYTEHAEILK